MSNHEIWGVLCMLISLIGPWEWDGVTLLQYSLKIWHLVAKISTISPRINCQTSQVTNTVAGQMVCPTGEGVLGWVTECRNITRNIGFKTVIMWMSLGVCRWRAKLRENCNLKLLHLKIWIFISSRISLPNLTSSGTRISNPSNNRRSPLI